MNSWILHDVIDARIIYQKGNSRSEDLSRELEQECLDHNLRVERRPGQHPDQARLQFGRWRLRPCSDGKVQKKMATERGIWGCLMSHWLLWQECLDHDKPILIFEHDAELKGPILQEWLQDPDWDVLTLDPALITYWEHYNDQHSRQDQAQLREFFLWSKPRQWGPYLPGAHAYIIRPQGAGRIQRAVKRDGVAPADVLLNRGIVRIRAIEPGRARVRLRAIPDLESFYRLSATRDWETNR